MKEAFGQFFLIIKNQVIIYWLEMPNLGASIKYLLSCQPKVTVT